MNKLLKTTKKTEPNVGRFIQRCVAKSYPMKYFVQILHEEKKCSKTHLPAMDLNCYRISIAVMGFQH